MGSILLILGQFNSVEENYIYIYLKRHAIEPSKNFQSVFLFLKLYQNLTGRPKCLKIRKIFFRIKIRFLLMRNAIIFKDVN